MDIKTETGMIVKSMIANISEEQFTNISEVTLKNFSMGISYKTTFSLVEGEWIGTNHSGTCFNNMIPLTIGEVEDEELANIMLRYLLKPDAEALIENNKLSISIFT
jgi:hypothetical protein